MPLDSQIASFLAHGPFAVVGASRDRAKYGNKVLRVYLQRGLPVTPVNPSAAEIEGLVSYPSLADIPDPPGAVSVITPPHVTEKIVGEVAAVGARHIWMQPGAESAAAVARAESLGLNVIAGGPCILVALGFREDGRPPSIRGQKGA